MTTERPILFSTPMVRAILAGEKSQTRRVIKGAQTTDPVDQWIAAGQAFRCPYGTPGDLLWVRETWAAAYDSDGDIITSDAVYRASNPDHQAYSRTGPFETYEVAGYTGWRPSIFMPRWASRLTLRITEVRVERLQDISEEDAIAEGCRAHKGHYWRPLGSKEPSQPVTARIDYAGLWDDINAKRGYPWESNPWVWAISFEREG